MIAKEDALDWTPNFFSPQVTHARRFYLDLALHARKRFSVVCGGLEQCTPDYVIDRGSFPYLSIEYVHKGKGTLQLNNAEVKLEPGVVFSYGPGIAHQIIADKDDPPYKYFIDFRGQDAVQVMRNCNLEPGAIRRIETPSEIKRILDDIIRDGSRGGPMAGGLCGSLLEYLLYRIATSTVRDDKDQSPAYQTYMRCRDYIEQHYLELQTLKQIAKEAHVDQAYLCRLFQRYDYQTPYHLLTRLKMNRAVELLHDPATLIKQVAATLGYADAFHFSRTFKGVFGVSPQAFRKHRS
jgi:AraC-like DNA-binding protein